jgi:hypothetical protein
MIVAYVTYYKTGQVARISTISAWGVEHFRDMTGEVVNDEGGKLWMCYLAFDIPIRYNDDLRQDIVQTRRQMPTKTGAQIDAMLLSLQAIKRIVYRMPDFSALHGCF